MLFFVQYVFVLRNTINDTMASNFGYTQGHKHPVVPYIALKTDGIKGQKSQSSRLTLIKVSKLELES